VSDEAKKRGALSRAVKRGRLSGNPFRLPASNFRLAFHGSWPIITALRTSYCHNFERRLLTVEEWAMKAERILHPSSLASLPCLFGRRVESVERD
jgi:hypothetical protein